MARRELGPAALRVTAAVAGALPGGDVTVGCSGGADSLSLALGAHRAAARRGVTAEAVVVDHGLQPGSADVATRVVETLTARGVAARVVAVQVHEGDDGLEAAAVRTLLEEDLLASDLELEALAPHVLHED